MPGCAAIGCTNSHKKGFVMKNFPKDPLRRKQWLIKTKRDKWEPTDHSVLCEVHFEPHMWEKNREDGKRKLKLDADPTVFSFAKVQPKRKLPAQRKTITSQTAITEFSFDATRVEPQPSTSTVSPPIIMQPDQPNPSSSSLIESTRKQSSEFMPVSDSVSTESDHIRKLYARAVLTVQKYKRQLRNANNKIKRLLRRIADLEETKEQTPVKIAFNKDQIEWLNKKADTDSTRSVKWTDVTVTNAFKLKFSCGSSGYHELLRQNIPLPSIRTLQRRVQNLKFDSGILHEVFEFLKIKINALQMHEKDCVLVLDEMAITPGRTYDTSLNKYFGDVTLPEHTGIATHVLVFMLGGVNTRWKQVVAYYFTGNAVSGSVYDNIIRKIFDKCDELGLNIISITSDMGASNQALWKRWGLSAGRNLNTNNYIRHYTRFNEKVYVLADVPHLFKNIKNVFITNKIITIPQDSQEKYDLPTNEICSRHVEDLVKYQEALCFQRAPKLSEEDLLPSHFNKMKVATSTNVISHDVAAGLKFISEELKRPEYLTTAWFIDQIEKWFYLMTSRHPGSALSHCKMDIYQETISFLEEFIAIIKRMSVGPKNLWKPSQTGVLISTQSILDIQKLLLDDKNYHFLLTSRFSQDCLENLFGVLPSKQLIPNAMQEKL